MLHQPVFSTTTASGLRQIPGVFLPLGVTAFGGPQAHIGLLQRDLVERRGWLSVQTFAELVAFCQFLPGPTSTQVVMALGLMRGGVLGALLAWACFLGPAATIMTLAALGLRAFFPEGSPLWLLGIRPAAVALIALAVWNLGRGIVTGRYAAGCMLAAALATLLIPSAYTAPLVLLAAGLFSYATAPSVAVPAPQEETLQVSVSKKQALSALVLFGLLLLGLPFVESLVVWPAMRWFGLFYRAGSLIFGGGYVLLPLLEGWVVNPGYINSTEFLDGLGLVQALPGPLFSISAYLGGVMGGVLGALVCLTGIFLPAFLLIYGGLPFWNTLCRTAAMRRALVGINAAVVGLIVAALFPLLRIAVFQAATPLPPLQLSALLVGSFGLMAWYRWPAPVVIILAAAGGVLLGWSP
ncbi:putative chromate transport protein [Candidatus Entotheonellaceae bacterium PAL068K]